RPASRRGRAPLPRTAGRAPHPGRPAASPTPSWTRGHRATVPRKNLFTFLWADVGGSVLPPDSRRPGEHPSPGRRVVEVSCTPDSLDRFPAVTGCRPVLVLAPGRLVPVAGAGGWLVPVPVA